MGDRLLQRSKVNARSGIGRQLEGLEAEHLKRVEKTEIGGRLHADGVPGLGYGLKRKGQSLCASARDGDLVGRQRLAPAQRAARDFLAKLSISLGSSIDIVVAALDTCCTCEKSIEAARRQEIAARDGASQRRERRVGSIFQQP